MSVRGAAAGDGGCSGVISYVTAVTGRTTDKGLYIGGAVFHKGPHGGKGSRVTQGSQESR